MGIRVLNSVCQYCVAHAHHVQRVLGARLDSAYDDLLHVISARSPSTAHHVFRPLVLLIKMHMPSAEFCSS
jgi:hypothetical protein